MLDKITKKMLRGQEPDNITSCWIVSIAEKFHKLDGVQDFVNKSRIRATGVYRQRAPEVRKTEKAYVYELVGVLISVAS